MQFDLTDDSFFAAPWPSDLRRHPNGTVNLEGVPGSGSMFLRSGFRDAEGTIKGFSLSPVVYFTFSGGITESELAGLASGEAEPIALVNIDAHSPERGKRVPLRWRYYAEDTGPIPAHTLALRPRIGMVMRPDTLYAAYVARSLKDAAGQTLGTSRHLEHIKSTAAVADPKLEAARASYRGAWDELDGMGVPRDSIAALTVFRTMVPHERFKTLFETATRANRQHVLSAEHFGDTRSYRLVRGYYCTPNYQQSIDDVPFLEVGGGITFEGGAAQPAPIPKDSEFHSDECGDLLRARYVLSIPRGKAMPAGGWPLMVHAHGTTGNAFSFEGEHDFAGWAALEGVAVVSTDQPLHGGDDPRGARPGSRKPFSLRIGIVPIPLPTHGKGSELAFYNALRPAVLRDNLLQASIDGVLLGRAMFSDYGASVLGAALGQATRFDRDRLMLVGHSQGCQSMTLIGAIDPLVKGVILSGCGGDASTASLGRKDTEKLRSILEGVLGFGSGALDGFHPLIAAMQLIVDPIDTQNFGPLYRRRLADRGPRSVLHFQGIDDSYTIFQSGDALTVALGAQPLAPIQKAGSGWGLLDMHGAKSVQGNAADGRATIAMMQFVGGETRDGHFVVFDKPEPPKLIGQFLSALAKGEAPRLEP